MLVDITKALQSGVINTYKTEAKDNYIVVITLSTKEYIIPLIKSGKECYAFINYEIEDYAKLSNIIDTVFDKELYKGMYKYKPIKSEAPDHDHKIIAFLPIKGGVKSSTADLTLKKAGYDVTDLDTGASIIKVGRNYTALLAKDTEAAEKLEEDKKMVSALNATFAASPLEFKTAFEGIKSGSTNGLILTGPTGTGKSFLARVGAVELNAPMLNAQITGGTCTDDLIGSFIPDATGETKWKFVMGPLLKAYVEGWALVIEEVNFGQPSVLAVLNQFTDFTGSVTVNGTVYKKHPNFVVIMTMNPGYDGTEVLNMALKNRFAVIDIPALSEPEYITRCVAYSKMKGHELPYEFFKKLYNFSNFLEKESASSRWHENCKFSIRNAQRLIDICLQKHCTLDDLKAAISVQYINCLSMDNDNSEKLDGFKNSDDIQSKIEDLFTAYDYCEIKVIEPNLCFEDIFTDEEPEEIAKEKADAKRKKESDDLFAKLGL